MDFYLVGVAGFEPATSCSQSRRDNRATLHPEVYYNKEGLIPTSHQEIALSLDL